MIHASPWSLNEKSLIVKGVATFFRRDKPVKAIDARSPVMRKYIKEQAFPFKTTRSEEIYGYFSCACNGVILDKQQILLQKK